MSLANKYRPKTFDEMIGQQHIIGILKAQMESRDDIHHNYLLFGPRGTGKTTSARLIAKGLNCLDLQHGNPCNQCVNCKLINTGTTLDYVEIDAASHTSVDDIREEIIERTLYPPTALKKKIYVIDEVHMLSKSAFNALLKTIEEPKGSICFILATTEIHKVPDTIVSRCQVFNYKKVPNEEMVKHLKEICESEHLNFSDSALEIIANISEGCVRDAVKYVDQVSILGDLSEANVSKFLGVAGEALIRELLGYIKIKDRSAVFSKLDEIGKQGIDLSQFAKQVIGYMDQHLLEDEDFYLNCGEIFGDIVSALRWYPYPVVAYKIVINKYLAQSDVKNCVNEMVEVGGNVKNVEEEKFGGSCENSVSKLDDDSLGKKQNIGSPSQEKSSMGGDSVEFSSSEGDSNGDNSHVQSQLDNALDLSALWAKVLSKMNKPTAQANLKDQAIIEGKNGNLVDIIVITPLARMLLDNEENKKLIEQLLGQEFGESISVNVRYVKKEEYFSQKIQF